MKETLNPNAYKQSEDVPTVGLAPVGGSLTACLL